jgi:hypothetical protein
VLQQPIKADDRALALEDPDVADSVKQFRPTVLEIRQRSAALIKLNPDGDHYKSAKAAIDDLVSTMALRCRRLCITVDTLMMLVNDDLDATARRGRAAPAGPTVRTLMARVTSAQAEEVQAKTELANAKLKVEAAAAARVAAEQAYGAYGAGRAR